MNSLFKDEFNWMLRENKGYFSWLGDSSYRLLRHLTLYNGKCFHGPCGHDMPPRDVIKTILENNVCENKLFDLFLKSLIRAEIRFISRYIPQRSHEERLTGNLVAEIDNSIYLVKDKFREASVELYGQPKEIDFLYYDLSRGGKIEKQTGADLGLILVIDLPDFPYSVISYVLQAKKIDNGRASLDRRQYETLSLNDEKSYCSYLFYDMSIRSLCAPLVVCAKNSSIKTSYEECKANNSQSFSISLEDMCHIGHPLSLFVISHMLRDNKIGQRYSRFRDAFRDFETISESKLNFSGRLGIVSLGKPINYSINSDHFMDIDI